MSTRTYPASLFRFLAPAKFSAVEEASAANQTRQISGVAYSGDLITDHGYDGPPIAFDLSRLQFAAPVPLLLGHSHQSTVGVVDSARIDTALTISGRLFSGLDAEAKQIADKADAGFPWQLSVGIYPDAVEEVPAGRAIVLNGRECQGPLTVFRQSRVREVSFVPLGADPQTSARIFEAGDTISIELIEDTNMPGVAPATDPHIAELEAEVAAEKAGRLAAETKITELESRWAEFQAGQHKAKVLALFAALDREPTDAAIAPYLAMSAELLQAVENDMRAMKAAVPAHLFNAGPVGKSPDKPLSLAEVNAAMLAEYAKPKAAA